jgi:plastocyanin
MRVRLLSTLALLVALVGCGSSNSPSTNATTISIAAGASLLTTTAYGVNPLTITAGTTVKWVNNDTMAHTATSDTGVWDSGQISSGGNFSFTFKTAGTYAYHCINHPGMVGVIIVV